MTAAVYGALSVLALVGWIGLGWVARKTWDRSMKHRGQ